MVLNDCIDGNWRDEIRADLPSTLLLNTIDLSVTFDESSAAISLSENDIIIFRRETDFTDVSRIRSSNYFDFTKRADGARPASESLSKPEAAHTAGGENVISNERIVTRPKKKKGVPNQIIGIQGARNFELKPFCQSVVQFEFMPTGNSLDFVSIVRIRYFGQKGEVLKATPHGFKSIGDGLFERKKPLPASGEAITEELPLVAPYGASYGEIEALVMGPGGAVPLAKLPIVKYQSSCSRYGAQSLSEHTDSADDNSKTIIYSTSAGPFRDDVLRLRPHYLSENFGRLGYNVKYIPLSDTLSSAHPKPGITQVRRSEFLLEVQKILHSPGKPGVFICSSLCDSPTFLMLDMLKDRGWTIVYEVRDDPEGMKAAGAGYGKWYNSYLERRICRLADVILTVSGPLRDRAIAFGGREASTFVLPNGLEQEAFKHVDTNWSDVAINVRKSRRNKVGYFGHMFGGRFDADAVVQAARALPNIEFELIGPGLHDPEQLSLPNVKLFGQRSIQEFYEISASWDVGILPFKTNRITFSLDPIKYYQYLAAGLKVVSSDVHNLRGAPLTYLYSADKPLSTRITEALETPVRESDADIVRSYLGGTTWELRASEMLRYIEETCGSRRGAL